MVPSIGKVPVDRAAEYYTALVRYPDFMDNYLGTSPWFLIAVTAIAFAGAFVRLVRWVKFFARERDGSRSEKDDTAN